MPEATYSIEFAKTSRSKCKKCKTPIEKGDMRMCITIPPRGDDGFEMTSYHHVGCFRLPRKYSTGATKISPEEFVEDYVSDSTDNGSILPKRLEEIAKLISGDAETAPTEATSSGKKRSAGTSKGKATATKDNTLIGRLSAAYLESQDEDAPAKKKVKKEKGAKSDDWDEMVKIYGKYHKHKLDDVKEVLRWNRQTLTGTKTFLLFKIIDGEIHGRLGVCGLCGGRLKFVEGEGGEDGYEVACNGRFDEDLNMRQPCAYKCKSWKDPKIPRLKPWYSEEPTEEEKEAMDKIIEDGRNQVDSSNGGSTSEEKQILLDKVEETFKDWDTSNKNGIQQATSDLMEFLQEGKVDLPTDKKKSKMAIGSMVVSNKDKTPTEVVTLIIDKYGFREDKAKKAAAKEATVETVCENPKNAPLVVAFQELASLYFKEGNRNAGATYTKVASRLKELKLEVTAENAIGLSKGKTKVEGVGKASAEKMKEFCQTGTMAKLEEKRQDAA